MTPEKIFEIAHRYSDKAYPTPDDPASLKMAYWEFREKDLIAFAKAIIEAERESSDEPVAWAVFDGEENWGLIQYLGNENFQEEFLKRNPDPMYRDWVKPLYEYPPPARKLTDEEIRLIVRDEVSDVTVSESIMFRAVARAIERRINGEEE